MSEESQEFDEQLRNARPICDWCGNELNEEYDDELCKYINR